MLFGMHARDMLACAIPHVQFAETGPLSSLQSEGCLLNARFGAGRREKACSRAVFEPRQAAPSDEAYTADCTDVVHVKINHFS